MTVYLLDVNVLIALCDPLHVHHEASHRGHAVAARIVRATVLVIWNGFPRIACRLYSSTARCGLSVPPGVRRRVSTESVPSSLRVTGKVSIERGAGPKTLTPASV